MKPLNLHRGAKEENLKKNSYKFSWYKAMRTQLKNSGAKYKDIEKAIALS
jgi:hypothetical protein